MKNLTIYINEELKKHPLWCEIALSMFKSSKNLTKESISDMLDSFCDIEGRFKKFSDYLAEEYPKEYLAYQPADDDFLSNEKNQKIKDQIAEFIISHIVKR